jgi:hypothetical protein
MTWKFQAGNVNPEVDNSVLSTNRNYVPVYHEMLRRHRVAERPARVRALKISASIQLRNQPDISLLLCALHFSVSTEHPQIFAILLDKIDEILLIVVTPFSATIIRLIALITRLA